MYFTTTRLHQETRRRHVRGRDHRRGARPGRACIPFKGDVDLAKFQKLIDEKGADKIPYICIATAVNMCGGQPMTLANLKPGA